MSAALVIQGAVEQILAKKSECSVMLTGGRTARLVYSAWSKLPQLKKLRGVRFYFGDERCVDTGHLDSNYKMVMDNLFGDGLPTDCQIYPMDGSAGDLIEAAFRYEKILPYSVDILLLGIGEDGHVASIFPKYPLIKNDSSLVEYVVGPKPPFKRLTITPIVIQRALSIYVLAHGSAKAKMLEIAKSDAQDVESFPARLALSGTWLLDK